MPGHILTVETKTEHTVPVVYCSGKSVVLNKQLFRKFCMPLLSVHLRPVGKPSRYFPEHRLNTTLYNRPLVSGVGGIIYTPYSGYGIPWIIKSVGSPHWQLVMPLQSIQETFWSVGRPYMTSMHIRRPPRYFRETLLVCQKNLEVPFKSIWEAFCGMSGGPWATPGVDLSKNCGCQTKDKEGPL